MKRYGVLLRQSGRKRGSAGRAGRLSRAIGRTFAREQHPGQQPRHGQAAPRQGGFRALLLGNARHRSSYQGKCYDYLYHRFIKQSCPCARHDGMGRRRCIAPLILNLGNTWRPVINFTSPVTLLAGKESPVPIG